MAHNDEKNGSNLNEKQRRFVREYLKDLNATQAAKRAGYSDITAYTQGVRLLKNVYVKELINIATERVIKASDATVDRVVRELCRLAFVDLAEFYEFTEKVSKLKDISNLTPDQTACIKEILITESRLGVKKIKVKLASKEKALELLMRHLGMMNDNLNVNVTGLGDFAQAAEDAAKDKPDDPRKE